MESFKIKDEYIKLGQALKASGLAESGVDAKYAVQDGFVKVNGDVCYHSNHSFVGHTDPGTAHTA